MNNFKTYGFNQTNWLKKKKKETHKLNKISQKLKLTMFKHENNNMGPTKSIN